MDKCAIACGCEESWDASTSSSTSLGQSTLQEILTYSCIYVPIPNLLMQAVILSKID